MGKTRLFAVAACAAAVVGVGASGAFAGEITGNGEKFTPVHFHIAASLCSFSGQEDVATSPLRTQTPHEVYLGPDIGVVNPPPGSPAHGSPENCKPAQSQTP